MFLIKVVIRVLGTPPPFLVQPHEPNRNTNTKLNSWGACVKTCEEVQQGKPLAQHQVHTGNVDNFKWNPNVQFYLTF